MSDDDNGALIASLDGLTQEVRSSRTDNLTISAARMLAGVIGALIVFAFTVVSFAVSNWISALDKRIENQEAQSKEHLELTRSMQESMLDEFKKIGSSLDQLPLRIDQHINSAESTTGASLRRNTDEIEDLTASVAQLSTDQAMIGSGFDEKVNSIEGQLETIAKFTSELDTMKERASTSREGLVSLETNVDTLEVRLATLTVSVDRLRKLLSDTSSKIQLTSRQQFKLMESAAVIDQELRAQLEEIASSITENEIDRLYLCERLAIEVAEPFDDVVFHDDPAVEPMVELLKQSGLSQQLSVARACEADFIILRNTRNVKASVHFSTLQDLEQAMDANMIDGDASPYWYQN